MEEAKAARVALSFFSNITLRKAFNQWLVWAQERQEYGVQLQQAVQVTLLDACGVTCGAAATSVRVFVSDSVDAAQCLASLHGLPSLCNINHVTRL